MQHSQDEKGTDLIALATAFAIFPFVSAVAGWLFGPIFFHESRDKYAYMESLDHSMISAGIAAVGAFVIAAALMLIRRVWHHTNPPAGYEETPEP